ncbi:MAG: hypothetical protein KGJ23_08235 [Euryarchaeota archaeon]|nr:hypothetical protein [Euryarchaeota archaeon]MDE1836590.1 hypothetical protein [Euryarchaeota archaeon]MDE1879215.1 hypothetical protein [Euryarchaeota archaeon]MDE2044560.1 hypothetical protein [Thermoplasmata archaeon]
MLLGRLGGQGQPGGGAGLLGGLRGGGGGAGGVMVTLSFKVVWKNADPTKVIPVQEAQVTIFGPLGMRPVAVGPAWDNQNGKLSVHQFQVGRLPHPYMVTIPGMDQPVRGQCNSGRDEVVTIQVQQG